MLRFTPESGYAIALRAGAALALALFVLLVCPPRRRRHGAEPARSGPTPALAVLCPLVAAAVALISLPAAAIVPVACLAARRRPRALSWIAAGAVIAATAVVVADPDPHPLEQIAAFGAPAQLLTVTALAFLGASLIPPRARRPDGG